MPSTKPEWNSFRPLAFLLAVAQVTSGFWWTGVCNELAMWRLQKAFSNSSATHDNERVKCSDLFVGLSLKVSSRLEIWQTQTLLVAHATTSISSFTCEILTKTSTKSTWRSTKLWNSKPLPNEETKKKKGKAGTVSALRLSSLLGFGGPPVDTLKKRRDDPRLDQMDSLQRGPGSHPYWLWTCLQLIMLSSLIDYANYIPYVNDMNCWYVFICWRPVDMFLISGKFLKPCATHHIYQAGTPPLQLGLTRPWKVTCGHGKSHPIPISRGTSTNLPRISKVFLWMISHTLPCAVTLRALENDWNLVDPSWGGQFHLDESSESTRLYAKVDGRPRFLGFAACGSWFVLKEGLLGILTDMWGCCLIRNVEKSAWYILILWNTLEPSRVSTCLKDQRFKCLTRGPRCVFSRHGHTSFFLFRRGGLRCLRFRLGYGIEGNELDCVCKARRKARQELTALS